MHKALTCPVYVVPTSREAALDIVKVNFQDAFCSSLHPGGRMGLVITLSEWMVNPKEQHWGTCIITRCFFPQMYLSVIRPVFLERI